MCQLFAVDMAFCGGEGLITDKASALIVMACSPVCCPCAVPCARFAHVECSGKRRGAKRLDNCSFTPRSLQI